MLKPKPWDGTAIAAPGAYENIPMSAYHGPLTVTPSASRSQLWKLFNQSPAHLWLTHYMNPDREEPEESKPLTFGRAAHHLILGEADFHSHFIQRIDEYPEGATYPSLIGKMKPWSSNSRWCQAWLADQQAHGLTVLTDGDMDAVRGMAGGLAAHPMVRAGILNGMIETTLVAQHQETGIWMKIRPDAIPTDGADVADLKTIADISDEGIERAIGDTGLAMQGAMTRMVYRLLGLEFSSFSLVFCEKAAPFCVRVKTLTDADLDLGETTVEIALQAYARCIERSYWPGPGGDQVDAQYAQMTPWARARQERKILQLQAEFSL